MELKDTFTPDHVELRERRTVFEGPIFNIHDDEIAFPTGEVVRRQWMEHDDAVAIVALRPSDKSGEDWDVLLIRQYRHPVRQVMWEIPAGLMDVEGEEAVKAAARELREETDHQATNWYRLLNFITSPGSSNEKLTVYIATGVTPSPVKNFVREAEEAELVVEWFGLNAVTHAVLSGDLASPSLVAGVLGAQIALQRGLYSLPETQLTLE